MTTMFYCAVHCGMVGLSMEPWRSPSIKGKAMSAQKMFFNFSE